VTEIVLCYHEWFLWHQVNGSLKVKCFSGWKIIVPICTAPKGTIRTERCKIYELNPRNEGDIIMGKNNGNQIRSLLLREAQSKLMIVLNSRPSPISEYRFYTFNIYTLNDQLNSRLKIFKIINIPLVVFWFVTPCSNMTGYQRFEGHFRHNLQFEDRVEGRRESSLPHKPQISQI
jgi:hypothetical protein